MVWAGDKTMTQRSQGRRRETSGEGAANKGRKDKREEKDENDESDGARELLSVQPGLPPFNFKLG